MTKFGTSSLLGTAADFLSFSFVFRFFIPLFWAEICAAFIGMVINFFMQKRFVFTLNRKPTNAFLLSVAFSLAFMYLGAIGIKTLSEFEFFAQHLLIAKVIVMGSKFVLNYFSKRWVFEK